MIGNPIQNNRKLMLKIYSLYSLFWIFIFPSETFFEENSKDSKQFIVKTSVEIRNALASAKKGDTILVKKGTYYFCKPLRVNHSGTSQNFIYFLAESERPIFDFSAMQEHPDHKGFLLDQNYWKIKGIKFRKAGDNGGMKITGNHNIIEYCDFSENADTGLQIDNGASENLILNCDSFFNADSSIENADGFACKLEAGSGNVFKSCRAWNNLDDGWDGYLRNNDNISTKYENCWAIRNGYLKDNSLGKGDDKNLKHNASYIRCLAVGNIYDGFDHNSNRGKVEIYNCSAYMNGRDYAFSNTNPLEELIIKNSISLDGTNSFNATTTDLFNNTWNDDFSVSEADFENLMVEELTAERQADGSLPQISFMHLVSGSDLIDAGVEVDGVEFNGTAPDLGAFEF